MNRIFTLILGLTCMAGLSVSCSKSESLKLDNEMYCAHQVYKIASASQAYYGWGTEEDPKPNTFRLYFEDDQGRLMYFGLVTPDKVSELPSGTYTKKDPEDNSSFTFGGFQGKAYSYEVTDGTVKVRQDGSGNYTIDVKANTEYDFTTIELSYNGPLKYMDERPLQDQIKHKATKFDITKATQIYLGNYLAMDPEKPEVSDRGFKLVFEVNNNTYAEFELKTNQEASTLPDGHYLKVENGNGSFVSGTFYSSGKSYPFRNGMVDVHASHTNDNQYSVSVTAFCTDNSYFELVYDGILVYDDQSAEE